MESEIIKFKFVECCWANKKDLESFSEFNKVIGFDSSEYPKHLMWSRQWEYAWVKQFLENVEGKDIKLLDVGSTPSTIMEHLVDPSWIVDCCDVIDAKGYGKFTRCDIKNSPYIKQSFNVVMSISTIEHDSDPVKCVREMMELVKKDGYVVLTLDHDKSGAYKLSRSELVRLCNFVNVRVPNEPENIIKSEEICNYNGLRVLGLILKRIK